MLPLPLGQTQRTGDAMLLVISIIALVSPWTKRTRNHDQPNEDPPFARGAIMLQTGFVSLAFIYHKRRG